MSILKKKGASAIGWSAAEQLGLQGTRFLVGIILARLLSPPDYGLLGMLGVFLTLAQAFTDSGFGQALVQKQDASQRDETSVFYLNVVFATAAGTLFALAAPLVAAFYRQPQLVGLARLMALDIVVNSLVIVQGSLLTKKLDFKTQMQASVGGLIIGGAVGITCALHGMGATSLGIQILTGDALRCVVLWRLSPWRPKGGFHLDCIKGMYKFGSRLLTINLIAAVFENLYTFIIGRWYDASSTGLYTRGKQLQAIPSLSFAFIVGRVGFPMFCGCQGDPVEIKRIMRKLLVLVALVHFPLMTIMACAAPSLIALLLTAKWLACAPFLRLFCLAGALFPLHIIHLNALKAQGHVDKQLPLELCKRILIVISIVASLPFGVLTMVGGEVAVAFVSYFINTYYSVRLLRFTWWEQLNDLFPYAVNCGISAAAMCCVSFYLALSPGAMLVTQGLVGFTTYLCLCYCLRLEALRQVTDVVRINVIQRVRLWSGLKNG